MSAKTQYQEADRRKRFADRVRDLWRLSNHEAGHAVIGCVLSKKTSAGADIRGTWGSRRSASYLGRGFAFLPEGVGDDLLYAIAVAAGREAEVLAQRHPPPPLAPFAPKSLPEPTTPALREALVREKRATVTDPDAIAQWAIRGHGDDPDSWRRRALRVRWEAYLCVVEHETAILAVASVIFTEGFVAPSEIARIFEREGLRDKEA